MKKLLLILSMIISCTVWCFGGNLHSIKGKTIVIPNLLVDKFNYRNPLPCVYTDKVLSKLKFKEEYLYPFNIWGDTIHINDIRILNEGKKNPTAVIIGKHNDNTIVIYIPTKFSVDKPLYSSQWFNLDSLSAQLGWSSANKIGRIKDIEIPYFDVSKMDSINRSYHNVILIPVKESNHLIYKDESDYSANRKNHRILMGQPYMFNHIEITENPDDQVFYCSNSKYKSYPHYSIILTSKHGDSIKVPVRNPDIEFNYVKSSTGKLSNIPSISSLSDFFISQDTILHLSKMRLNSHHIDSCKNQFLGKEIFFSTPENPYISYLTLNDEPTQTQGTDNVFYRTGENPSGLGLLEEVIMLPSKTDIPYMKYFAIIKNYEKAKRIAVPIDSNFSSYVMLASEHQAIQEREKREREAQEKKRLMNEQKEERDYYNSLVRKYGKSNAQTIIEGSVKIGFTKAMCEEAWGTPYDKTRVTTQFGSAEAWWYGYGNILYFQGNKLVMIQD